MMFPYKTLLLTATLMLSGVVLPVMAQDADTDEYAEPVRHPVVIPGKGHFNVENLSTVNLDMDISQLSLAELRVVRNALAARQGYLFNSKDLRSLFASTTWYDSLMTERWMKVEETYSDDPIDYDAKDFDERVDYARRAEKYVPLQYTAAEQQFLNRVHKREAELQKLNFQTQAGERVNVGNILNPWQVKDFTPELQKALARDGFAIVESNGIQLFHIYEQNNYNVFPSFVTTDLYLQLFHFYFDNLLRDIEEQKLDSCLRVFCDHTTRRLNAATQITRSQPVREAAQWLLAYMAIASELLTGKPVANVPKAYAQDVRDEVDNCTKAENNPSTFLGYTNVFFPYNLFRPRGHYTRSESLQRYFRAMMWLQTAPFATDNERQMQRAVLLAYCIGSDATATAQYQQLTEPLTFLLGAPDNVSIMQVYEEAVRMNKGKEISGLLTSRRDMRKLTTTIEQLAARQTRINPKNLLTAKYKVNLMPQRYMPDSEVLQEMADTETQPTTLRKAPKALDIMAALGVSSAERILLNELKEAEQWPQYTTQLQKMKQRMGEVDWRENVANRWIDATKELTTIPDNAPYFMQSPNWQKKSLNTALASYAELKHDAILYAKQPFGAECGGGGPPEPVLKGYVEPSIAFWRKAVELNDTYTEVLKKFHLMTLKAEAAIESVSGMAKFLLRCSEKELAGTPLSNSENDQIEIIGSTIEYISLELARSEEQYLMSWDDINGPDRNVACIADVYTANAFNIPDKEKAVLYEAIGPAYEIYVIVELQGQLWLTRGAVFSYRELERPVSAPRLTDEEWQQWLDSHLTDGTPKWMKPIILPMKNKPKENAAIFYSSGC